jgi:hypothetical protein
MLSQQPTPHEYPSHHLYTPYKKNPRPPSIVFASYTWTQHQPQSILDTGSAGGASVVTNPRGFNTGLETVPDNDDRAPRIRVTLSFLCCYHTLEASRILWWVRGVTWESAIIIEFGSTVMGGGAVVLASLPP